MKMGKNKELTERKSQLQIRNPRGQPEDSGLHSHSKITGLLHKFGICGPVSRILRGGGKNLGQA
jgi:hypothetical protein